MNELQNRLATALSRAPFLTGNGSREENITVADWEPLVDVTEDDKEYVIKAELPEIKKENVKVTVEDGVLSIAGERKFEKEEKDKKYHRIERAYGSFVRSFSFPDDADASKVNAEFKDGVLLVHLVKNEKAQPKTIEVKVG
jgi:HSP20 family protein